MQSSENGGKKKDEGMKGIGGMRFEGWMKGGNGRGRERERDKER